ncbi:MAG: hypothetical protein AAGD10_06545 [Myxococcota bacterium]
MATALGLLYFGLAGCETECDRFDVVRADAVGRPDPLGEDVDLLVGVGSGGLVVDSSARDLSLFEPVRGHVISGTPEEPGMFRWSLIARRELVLVVEHRLPLERNDILSVDSVLDDLVFTGGRGTTTWWDAGWQWTEGSTLAANRAVLTEAFERALSTRSVSGTIEVRETAPMSLRVGLRFENGDGSTSAFWSDVRFDAENDVEACP